jgi:hypothetical protein
MSQSLRVAQAVARNTDPITSTLAGENRDARQESEREVYAILANTHRALSDHEIYEAHELAALITGDRTYTPQRIRTARDQLVKNELVKAAGRRAGASPTGRSAMTWSLA